MNLTFFLENKLAPVAAKIGSNRVLTIIRNAMTANMGLLIIGSISIMLSNIPYAPLANLLEPLNPFFNAIFSATTGLVGLLTAASVGYYAAMEYDCNIFSSISVSVAVFFITQLTDEWTIDMGGLGTAGMITAIVVGFITVKVMAFFTSRKIVIKMPEGVPPAVSESFISLIPAAVLLAFFSFIHIGLGFNLNTAISWLLSPIANALNTLPGYAVYHMLCGLVFFCGINSMVVIGIVEPFIRQFGTMNEMALVAGEPLKYAVTWATDSMIWSGGTGATIGIVLLMSLIARSKYFKTLGRMSFFPGVFNINEPIIFGVPICFNPLFLFPFVVTPGILAASTYAVMNAGLVAMPSVANLPWTTPPIVIGFLMSGGALSTTIWSAIVVLISLVIYFPFFKIADKQQYLKEQSEKAGA